MKKLLALAAIVVFILAANPCWAEIPHLIHYQGMLTDDLSEPLNGTYDLTFSIYSVSSGGTAIWTEVHSGVEVGDGLFNVVLGSETTGGIPSSVFDSDERYLGIKVGTDSELTPRVQVASVGYAYRAEKGDTADMALSIVDNSITSDKIQNGTIQFSDIGQNGASTDQVMKWNGSAWAASNDEAGGGSNWSVTDSVLYTNKFWGIARGGAGNVLFGNSAHTMVNLGVACTTGASGENYKYCTVGGGYKNTAGYFGTVAGGEGNTASSGATVAGGDGNTASDNRATVGGGGENIASNEGATVTGGEGNTASGQDATVGGGSQNTASENYTTVGGGGSNTASGNASTVGGGTFNTASGSNATVGGGNWNTASDGGATVAGGIDDTASAIYSTVGGGYRNTASGDAATVGGGRENTARDTDATVGGGIFNTANGYAATVGGGDYNAVSGDHSAIPGGCQDTVAGSFSLAAGRHVTISASGNYTFAFGHDFTTSTPNAVIFHNSVDPIKVGIGTPDPTGKLDVNGDGIRIRSSKTPASSSADGYTGEIVWDSDYIYICTSGDGPGGGTDTWKRAALSTW